MKLFDLIDKLENAIFLVDASGVLYSSNGFLAQASKTFNYLQTKSPTFLASNNSYHYVNDIKKNLHTDGNIKLNVDNIISSGHGLAKDPTLSNLIENKIIYFIGPDSAKHYALDAPIKGLTKDINKAEAIILAGFNESQSQDILETVTTKAKKDPTLPIICCNKDRYIRANQRLQPVVGYFAEKIENNLNRPIHWFGKPLKNFSDLVTKHLNAHNLSPNKSTLFFDDNIDNVVSMQNHLGISGCWVKKTGIYFNENEKDLIKTYGKPTYSIETFNLNDTIKTY